MSRPRYDPARSKKGAKHRPCINRDDAAGDASRIAPRREKYIGARKIVRHQGGPQRSTGCDPLREAGIGELRAAILAERNEPAQIRQCAAGRHAVHPNVRSQLRCKLTDHPDDRMLRGGIAS